MEKNNETSKVTFREFFGRYGGYLVIMLVITAAAIVSVFAFPDKKNDTAKESDNSVSITDAAKDDVKSIGKDNDTAAVGSTTDERLADMLDPLTGKPYVTAKNPQGADAVQNTPIPDFTQAPTDSSETQELCNPPVNGEVIWDYAMDELIYSATLDQWTTHCGVDIACKQGDPVHAVKEGRVESVYEDDAYGITVVIVHKNGHKTVYSNLAQDEKLIKAGVSVKANTVIGSCGKTAKFECADKSHIHFEYHVNGKPVNPHKYVRFKKD